LIENNFVRDVSGVGIQIQAGTRERRTSGGGIEDSGANSDSPTPGSPINFDTQNIKRFAPGVVIQNNVVAGFGTTGIYFAGENNAAGNVPAAAVPVGKIINNTVYGGATRTGTGIRVQDNAAPIVLNNIVANTVTGISLESDGVSNTDTVIGRTMFHNTNPGTPGSNAITDLPGSNPLFVDPSRGNFYLDDGAEAIDRSLGSLPDLPAFVSVKNPLEIPNSDAFSPKRDLFGQPRVDDAGQPPSGVGNEVFYDLGAIERADARQPTAMVIVPMDQGLIDDDDDLNEVRVLDERMAELVIQLSDYGIGVDDLSVLGSRVHVWRDLDESTFDYAQFLATGNPPALVEDADYLFRYDQGQNRISLISTVGFWPQGATYTILLEDAIQDLAGNLLLPTGFPDPFSGLTVFKITLAGWDYGDAPDTPWNTYPSRFQNDGARHMVNTPYFLGSGVSQENYSPHNATATGDLFDDGVRLDSSLWNGNQANLTITASAPGYLSAWIDYNGNGNWSDPGEQIFSDEQLLTAGDNPRTITVPDALLPGELVRSTFARFRFSSETGLGATGYAIDGEVEDYQVRLVRYLEDYGDAPIDDGEGVPWYPTLSTQGGASHFLAPDSPFMGAGVDAEPDGQPDATATGDDLNGSDEDGVVLPAVLIADELTTIPIDMTGSTFGGLLDAWVDFNQDGQWDASEQIFASQLLIAGSVNTPQFTMPATLTPGPSFTRFRISTAGGLSFDGAAADGEVEDYQVQLAIPPVADANGPYSGNEGSDIPLDGSGSYDPDGTIVLYEWDFDYDGVTFDVDATGVNPIPIFNAPDNGTFTVGLRVTDNDGATDIATAAVIVDNVDPTADAGADQTVDEGDLVSFSGSFADPGSADTHTYDWAFGDGGTATGSLTPDHTYVDNGVYIVTLTVTDDDFGVGTDTLTVTVDNVAPTVNAGPDETINEGDSVSFSGSFFDPGSADTHTIQWDFGDGSTAIGSLTPPDHTYVDNGVYIVTLTITDNDLGVGTDTLTVTVINVAPIVAAGPDQTANEGDLVSFVGSFTDPGTLDTHTIVWDFGDGNWDSGSLTTNHRYADNGSYTVTLTVTDNDGGVGSDTLAVTVANVDPTVDAGPDQTVDEGDLVSLPGSFSDPGSADTHTFLWHLISASNGQTIPDGTAQDFSFTPNDNGVYTFDFTVTDDDLGSHTDTVVV
ncbi:MAG: PKD domain-containing protein, partial [Planctomycetota bacterium]